MIKKKVLLTLLVVFFLVSSLSIVLAQDIEISEIIKQTTKANRPLGFFGFLQSILNSDEPIWAVCNGVCPIDCNPCGDMENSNLCYWGVKDTNKLTHFSLSDFCSDSLMPDSFDKMCYCIPPRTECRGGGQLGDIKCEGDLVFKCNELKVWEFTESCEFGCVDGICLSSPPPPTKLNYSLFIAFGIVGLFVIVIIILIIKRKKRRKRR